MSDRFADLAEITAGLTEVTIYVCRQCIAGEGGECHWPGCAYWMHDAPDEQFAATLRFDAL